MPGSPMRIKSLPPGATKDLAALRMQDLDGPQPLTWHEVRIKRKILARLLNSLP